MRLRALISRRWLLSTVLVVIGMGVMVRLGFWQLDRLAQRRAANALVQSRLDAPPVDLTAEPLPLEPDDLNLRTGTASGVFDFEREISLRNEAYQGQPGVHLLTPLVLADGRALLVDRGWLPYEQSQPEQWAAFHGAAQAEVAGMIRTAQPTPAGADLPPVPELEWFRVDIDAIQRQMPYSLLPVYLQAGPATNAGDALPVTELPAIELSEGPHLGYAIQWYLFVVILGVGYVRFVMRQNPALSGEKTTL
ncbi:MAG: SURF1 family protein [Anaerolineales bacterium]